MEDWQNWNLEMLLARDQLDGTEGQAVGDIGKGFGRW